MPSELAPLTRRLGLRKEQRSGIDVRAGSVAGRAVLGAVIGVGPAAAGRSMDRLLDALDADLVVMVGICGGIDPALDIGDVVVPTAAVDDDTARVVTPGPLPGLSQQGKIVTCAGPILDDAHHERWQAEGIVGIDMETAAVGAVSEDRGVPWSAVRAVSDRPADGLVDTSILELLREDGSPNLPAMLRRVVRHPGTVATLNRLRRDSSLAASNAVNTAITAIGKLDRPGNRS